MMKALALCLLFTSLATAGIFTPSSEKHNWGDDVTVKEGRAGVVVEFEKDDGNTKVSISPQDAQADDKGYVTNAKDRTSGRMEETKEKIKEAASSVLPDPDVHLRFRPRELVCDAYGKCKHKIASYMEKTKEAVAAKAHEAADKVHEVEEEAKEAVTEAVGKVQDMVTHTAHKASDKAHEMKETVKDAAHEIPSKARDKLSEKASEMKEVAKEQAEKAKQQVHDVIDTVKKVKEEAERSSFEKMDGAKEKVRKGAKEGEELAESASGKAKHGVHELKKEGQKGLRRILRPAARVLSYMAPPVRMASGVLHLLGFAAAYGMCVWVTFASNYVLAGALPRQQFAMVQSKIYPVYFKAMAVGVGTALIGHLTGQRKRFSPLSMGMLQGFNLMVSFLMILVNLLYLEPRATKVMFERMKKEKEEGNAKEPSSRYVDATTETAAGRGTAEEQREKALKAAVKAQEASEEKREKEAAAKPRRMRSSEILRRLNSHSSLLNVLTLMSLTWHLVHLGHHLHTVC